MKNMKKSNMFNICISCILIMLCIICITCIILFYTRGVEKKVDNIQKYNDINTSINNTIPKNENIIDTRSILNLGPICDDKKPYCGKVWDNIDVDYGSEYKSCCMDPTNKFI